MQENKIFKWALILAIIIVSNLFFNYSLSLIFNGPEFDEYCSFEKTSQVIEDREKCEAEEGIWNPGQKISVPMNEKAQIIDQGSCDLYSKCQNKFQEAEKIYEKKVFVALIIIGSIILVASAFIKSNPVLNTAFPLIAVLDLIIASIRYWRYSDELLKVSILFIALLVLIYLAVKKFKK
jgi:hypothetical protein